MCAQTLSDVMCKAPEWRTLQPADEKFKIQLRKSNRLREWFYQQN